MNSAVNEDLGDFRIPHVLCELCKALARCLGDPKPPRRLTGRYLRHCRDLTYLKSSSRRGCHLCSLIWGSCFEISVWSESLPLTDQDKYPEKIEAWKKMGGDAGIDILIGGERGSFWWLKPFVVGSFPKISGHMICTSIHRAESSASNRQEAQYSTFTGSEAVFQMAKVWLSNCISNHQGCTERRSNSLEPRRGNEVELPSIEVSRSSQAALTRSASNKYRISQDHSAVALHSMMQGTSSRYQLPTRLLALDSSSDCEQLRLILSSQIGPGIEYLTLSHCWGHSRFLTLSTTNMNRLMEGIPMDDLPLTFQHAIRITRKLGYRYLWIDSLCILQDSEEDWVKESASMADVYKNSVCNIAALAAKNSYEGCFSKRDPLRHHSCKLIDATSPWEDRLTAVPSKGFPEGNYPFRGSPLYKRAWVIQERILSPRTLCFGTDIVAWECGESVATDWLPDEHISRSEEEPSLKDAFRLIKNEKFASFKPNTEVAPDPCYKAWNSIIQAYTSCDLTFPRDKLVAISGVFQELEKAIGWSITAGLWCELLPPELLWYAVYPRPRPAEYRAPSWSWACIDSPIRRFYAVHDGRAAVHHVKVRGSVVDLKNMRAGWNTDAKLLSDGSMIICGPFRELGAPALLERLRSDNSVWGSFYPDTSDQITGVSWLLTIMHTNIKGGDIFHQYEGIVVVPSDTTYNCWRRVGLFIHIMRRDTEYLGEERRIVIK